MAARVGTIYVELNLDNEQFTKAMGNVYKQSTTAAKTIEDNFRRLGSKSDSHFQMMANSAIKAYEAITASSRKSAEDQIRAMSAMQAKINSINAEKVKSQSFEALGIRSAESIYTDMQNTMQMYKLAKVEAGNNASELVRIEEAKNARLMQLHQELNADAIAKSKAAAESQRRDQEKLGQEMANEIEHRIALQKAEAEAYAINNKMIMAEREKQNQANAEWWLAKMQSDKESAAAPWQTLGVRSSAEIEAQKKQVVASYEEIKNSGKATAQDLINIERSKTEKLKHLDSELLGHREVNLASLTRSVLRFYTAYYVASTAVQTVGRLLMGGVEAIDQMKISAVSVAAQITNMQGPSANVAENYRKNLEYAKALVPVFMEIDANSFANLEQIQKMNMAMVNQGVILDTNNAKQVEAFTAISNSIALMTSGQDPIKQATQEMRALMSGNLVAGAEVARNIDAIIKKEGVYKDGLKEIVAEGRKHGDTLERLAPYYEGITAAGKDIQHTWASAKASLETAWTILQTDIFKDFYAGLVTQAGNFAKYLKANSEDIVTSVNNMFDAITKGSIVALGALGAWRLGLSNVATSVLGLGNMWQVAIGAVVLSNLLDINTEFGKTDGLVKGLYGFYQSLPDELVGIAGYGILGRMIFGGWIPALLFADIAGIVALIKKAEGELGLSARDGALGSLEKQIKQQRAEYERLAKSNQYIFGASDEEVDQSFKTLNNLIREYNRESGIAKGKTAELLDGLTDMGKITENIKTNSAPSIGGFGKAKEELEEEEKARKKAADAAQNQAEKIQGVIDNLKWELSIMNLSEEEQKALNAVRSSGASISSAQGQEIYNLTKQVEAENQARKDLNDTIEAHRTRQEEANQLILASRDPLEMLKDELRNVKDLYDDGFFGSGAAGEARYIKIVAKMGADSVDAGKSAEGTAKKVEDAWTEAAKNIQNAWSGFLTDVLTGEFNGVEGLLGGIGNSLATAVSNNLVAGLASATSMSGVMSAFGAINPYMLAGGVGLSALSSYLGKENEPSFGEQVGTAIRDLIDALEKNTKTLTQQAEGLSDFAIAVSDMVTGIVDDAVFSKRTLAGNLALPDIAGLPGYENFGGVKRLHSTPKQSEDFVQSLYDSVGATKFYEIMNATVTDGTVLMNNMRDILGFANVAEETWAQIVDDYTSGSHRKQMTTTVSGIVAVMDEAFAKIRVLGMETSETLSGLSTAIDRENMTSYQRSMAEINDAYDPLIERSAEYLEVMRFLLTTMDPASESAKGLAEQIGILERAEEYKAKAVENANAKTQKAISETLTAMDSELNPLEGLDLELYNIGKAATAYYETLIDNNMAIDDAKTRTDEWAKAMSDAAIAEDAATKAAEAQKKAEEELKAASEAAEQALKDAADAARQMSDAVISARMSMNDAFGKEFDAGLFLQSIGLSGTGESFNAMLNSDSQQGFEDSLTELTRLLNNGSLTVDQYTSATGLLIDRANDFASALKEGTDAEKERISALSSTGRDAGSWRRDILAQYGGSTTTEYQDAISGALGAMEGFRQQIIDAGGTVADGWKAGGYVEKEVTAAIKSSFMESLTNAMADDYGKSSYMAGLEEINEKHADYIKQINALIDTVENEREVRALERNIGKQNQERAEAIARATDFYGNDPALTEVVRHINEQFDAVIAGKQNEIADLLAENVEWSKLTAQAAQNAAEATRQLNLDLLQNIRGTIYDITGDPELLQQTIADMQAALDAVAPDDFGGQYDALMDIYGVMQQLRDIQRDQLEETINSYKALDDVINELRGGNLAPVQSREFFERRYQQLLTDAKTGDAGAISNLTGFVNQYADFMKSYGETNYKDFTERVIQDFDGIQFDISGGKTLDDLESQLNTLNETYMAPVLDQLVRIGDILAAKTGSDAITGNIPGYASGGYHSGGLRLVGERGPEIEFTGPSRIAGMQEMAKTIAEAVTRAVNGSNRGGESVVNVTVKLDGKDLKNATVDVLRTNPDAQRQVRRIVKAA